MKTPKEIAESYISIGKTKTELPILKMIILGVFAGIFIALAGVGSTYASCVGGNASVKKLLGACVFPAGLIMVVIAGSELFTGNNLIIISVLTGDVKLSKMLKNWLFVYLGNLIGSLFVSLLMTLTLEKNGNALTDAFITSALSTASLKANTGIISLIAKGLLCNYLVCIAVWGAVASDNVGGKIAFIFFPIMLFVLCGFEHSVANMYYLSLGLMLKAKFTESISLTVLNSVLSLIWVTLGNIIGGAGIVGFGYYLAYLKKQKNK